MGASLCTWDGSSIMAIKVAGAASSQTAAGLGAIGAGAASRKGPVCQMPLPCAAPFPPGGWEGFLHQALHNIWRRWPAPACLAMPEQRRDDAHDV